MAGVLIGLKDLHYAILDETTGTYGTPVKFAKAIEATITPSQNTATLYADDAASEVINSMGNIEVSIGVDNLTTEAYAALLGKEKNADGVVVDRTDDTAPYVALGFRSLKSNGKYRYMWLYKGRFQQSEESYTTKGEDVEFNTASLSAIFVANDDGEWRARVDEDDTGVAPAVITGWFTGVYESTPTV